jgi:predicted nucleic acid-binding protein
LLVEVERNGPSKDGSAASAAHPSSTAATCALPKRRPLRKGRADLLIAAAAAAAGVAVLHYDEDYDRIAAIAGQEARWIAPRGSLG